DLMADAREIERSKAAARPGLADPDPTARVLVPLPLPVPVEVHLHPSDGVSVNLLPRRPHHHGGLWAAHHGLRRQLLRPKWQVRPDRTNAGTIGLSERSALEKASQLRTSSLMRNRDQEVLPVELGQRMLVELEDRPRRESATRGPAHDRLRLD